jgi:hypothetical protein
MFVGGSVALLRSWQPPRLGWSDHPILFWHDWPTNLKTVKRLSQPKALRREIAGKAQAKRIRFDPLFQTRHSLELTTLLFVILFFLYVCFGIILVPLSTMLQAKWDKTKYYIKKKKTNNLNTPKIMPSLQ